MKPNQATLKLLLALLLAMHSASKMMQLIDNHHLDRHFRKNHIQFYVVTQPHKSDSAKEILRKIEGIFTQLDQQLERDWSQLEDSFAGEILARIELFEIVRTADLEYRFSLEKQLINDDRPARIDKAANSESSATR